PCLEVAQRLLAAGAMDQRDALAPVGKDRRHRCARPLSRALDEQQSHICVRWVSITHPVSTPKAKLPTSRKIKPLRREGPAHGPASLPAEGRIPTINPLG